MPTQLTFTSYSDLWNYKDVDYTYKNAESTFKASAIPGVAIMKKLSHLLLVLSSPGPGCRT